MEGTVTPLRPSQAAPPEDQTADERAYGIVLEAVDTALRVPGLSRDARSTLLRTYIALERIVKLLGDAS